MLIRKPSRYGLAALVLAALIISAPLYALPGDPIAPSAFHFEGNSILTQGEEFDFTTENAGITFIRSGSFVFLLESATDIFDIRFDVRDFGRNQFDFVPGQTYTGTIGQAVAGQPLGPYMSASANGVNCNDDARTTGEFTIQEYQWQYVYFPKGLEIKDAEGNVIRVLPEDNPVSFAVTRFKLEFELRCNGEANPMTGSVDFFGEAGPVPENAIQILGPTDVCFDPSNAGTGSPCTPTDGTPGGPGDGGGVEFPTFPPPPPAPDVTIGLPPSISEAPFLQLTNNSSTGFSFSTNPGSANTDVHLSVTSNATEADNFQVSVDPAFIAAPGAGEATVTISAGPNTFPKTYVVTLTATANGKSDNITFLVDVACDPPMILGIDQPRNQRVTRGSTATVEVKATGSGPFNYQWFRGRRGSTKFPVAGASGASFTTSAVQGSESYWVRVSNACGTVDSNSVSVSPR
jgi:hypothetical protein